MVYQLDVGDDISVCPYCSQKPVRLQGVNDKKYWIYCDNNKCFAQPETRHYRINGWDIKAWNKGRFII